VGIIMDGNGRWAKARGLSRSEGHMSGAKNLRSLLGHAQRHGIRYMTIYAFSTENWLRPVTEVNALMSLLDMFLKKYADELVANRIRLNAIGRLHELPAKCLKTLQETMARTADCNNFTLTIALNYGSRVELIDATKRIFHAIEGGDESLEALDWEIFSKYLDTADLPDPDLIIRTSGESRLSNFLLLQAAYAEIFISPVFWPDFNEEELAQAVEFYQSRERRFGKTSEQLVLQTGKNS
jgi:undecaprenyl diphosphate synthase